MNRSVDIHLRLTYDPRLIMPGLALSLLLACCGELASESVTLTTFYPSPSGVYTQMITTASTFLARDAGRVTIGGTTGVSKLTVAGETTLGTSYAGTRAPQNGLIVQGWTGLGVSAPKQQLEVGGNAEIDGNSIVDGNATFGGNAVVTGGPKGAGYVYIDNSHTGCQVGTIMGDGAVCSPGRFATWVPGFYVEGVTYQDRGGPVVGNYPGGSTVEVKGLNEITGVEEWVALQFTAGSSTFYCCPK